MLSQDVLREELARRVAESAAGLGHPPNPPIPPAGPVDLDRLAAALGPAPDMVAVAVLRRLEPASFVLSALEFALGVDAGHRDPWFRAFTPTIFLHGNPANLAGRFRFDRIAADGSVAWFGPAPGARCIGLRRLLKLFDVRLPPEPPAEIALDVPGESGAGPAREVRLYMATARLRVGDYLVHLNHTLAEAALTGVVVPGDRMVVRHVPALCAAEIGSYRRLRVHRDHHDPARLRAYSCLSVQEPSAAATASGYRVNGPSHH